MKYVQVDIGVHTADAEQVAIQFSEDALIVTYIDWQEQPQQKEFLEVLAFRWQEFDEGKMRDDVVYEVMDSPWLVRQCQLQGNPAVRYAHYTLCFNACGALDVLCRREG